MSSDFPANNLLQREAVSVHSKLVIGRMHIKRYERHKTNETKKFVIVYPLYCNQQPV